MSKVSKLWQQHTKQDCRSQPVGLVLPLGSQSDCISHRQQGEVLGMSRLNKFQGGATGEEEVLGPGRVSGTGSRWHVGNVWVWSVCWVNVSVRVCAQELDQLVCRSEPEG